MSDTSQGDGWWIASNGKWYPPEQHPSYQPPTPPAPAVVGAPTNLPQAPHAPAPGVVPPSTTPPSWTVPAGPAAGGFQPVATSGSRGRGRRLATAGVVAVIAGAGGFAAWSFYTGESGGGTGASSAEAAADQFFASIDGEDPIGMLEILNPDELGGVYDLSTELVDAMDSAGRDADGALPVDLTVTGAGGGDIAYTVEPLGGRDDLVRIEVEALELSVTGRDDTAYIIQADATTQVIAPAEIGGARLTLERSGATTDITLGLPDEEPIDGEGPVRMDLIAVERDGRWYVSPQYTIAELIRSGLDGRSPDFGTALELIDSGQGGSGSPEEAVTEMAEAISRFDYEGAAALLDPASVPVAHDYLSLLQIDQDDIDEALDDFRPELETLDVTASEDGVVLVDELSFSFDNDNGGRDEFTLDADWCLTVRRSDDDTDELCLRDELDDLIDGAGLADQISADDLLPDQPELVTSERGGSWYFDPTRTIRRYVSGASDVLVDMDGEGAQLPTTDLVALLEVPVSDFGTAVTLDGPEGGSLYGAVFTPTEDDFVTVNGEFGEDAVSFVLLDVDATSELIVTADGYEESFFVDGPTQLIAALGDGGLRSFGVLATEPGVTVTASMVTPTVLDAYGETTVTIGSNGEPAVVVFEVFGSSAGDPVASVSTGGVSTGNIHSDLDLVNLEGAPSETSIGFVDWLAVSGAEPGSTVTITTGIDLPDAPPVDGVDQGVADRLYSVALDQFLDTSSDFDGGFWDGCGVTAPTGRTVQWGDDFANVVAVTQFSDAAAAQDYLVALEGTAGQTCGDESNGVTWEIISVSTIADGRLSLEYTLNGVQGYDVFAVTDNLLLVGEASSIETATLFNDQLLGAFDS